MKKLSLLLLFTSLFSYAQIDYKSLVKNLEDITLETNLESFFKDIPSEERYDDLEIADERFLRFHSIIIDKVRFSNNWRSKSMSLYLFNEEEDFKNLKRILTEIYGKPKEKKRSNLMTYEWSTEKKEINLEVLYEDEKFLRFNSLVVDFIKEGE